MYRFTMDHVIKGRKTLRQAAGMWEETFNERQYAQMLADEIRTLRGIHFSDEEIAELLRTKAHIEIEPATIAACAGVTRRKKAAAR